MANWDDFITQAYTTWRMPLLRWLTKRLRNPSDAEDLLQEAYTRWAESPAATRPDKPRSYLAQIALNLQQEPRYQRTSREREGQRLEYQSTALADHGANPLDSAQSRQTLTRLEAAIGELPPRQRHAFTRHRFDDVSYADLAKEMGISKRMVAKHIANALAYCQLRILYPNAQHLASKIDR